MANPRRELTTGESKRLARLEAIADKLRRGENVQNRQLQRWLSVDEFEQLEAEWQGYSRRSYKMTTHKSNQKFVWGIHY